MSRVAVVGAGVTGLVCARELVGRGHQVIVFDKGRSVGGRLAVRRVGAETFDLGAQYVTARDPRFARQVEAWVAAGVCRPWVARVVAVAADGTVSPAESVMRYVGAPGMNVIAHALAQDLEIWAGHRVERIVVDGGRLLLSGSSAHAATLGPATRDSVGTERFGTFDQVVMAMPPTQAETVLADIDPVLARELRAVAPFEPCFAVGLAADALREVPFDAAFVGRAHDPDRVLAWVARDSSKPERPAGERWVLHASSTWTRAWFDRAEPDVIAAMVEAFAQRFALPTPVPSLTVVRRWALARAVTPLALGALESSTLPIRVGGDWTSGGRIESAYLSGLALAAGVPT